MKQAFSRVFFKITFILLAPTLASADAGITYHGRLLKPNGQPVTSSSVQFRIQIRTSPASDCLMFEEVQTKDLSGSNGLFVVNIGDGSATVVNTEPFGISEVFQNKKTLTFPGGKCTVSHTATLGATDARQLKVSFNDGTFAGWEPLPTQDINFVPMAMESVSVGGHGSDNFFRVHDPPGIPQVISAWSQASYQKLLDLVANTTISGGNASIGGNAAGFTGSLAGDVTGGQSSTKVEKIQGNSVLAGVPSDKQVLTWNHAQLRWEPANVPVAGNPAWNDITGKPTEFAPGGNATGDLTGTYPNPTIATSAVSGDKIVDGGVAFSKIAAGSATGQVLQYEAGVGWKAGKLLYTDLIKSGGGSPWPTTPCTAGKAVVWQSATDGFECAPISITETDPLVKDFAKADPSTDFETTGGVLTLKTVPITRGGTGAVSQSGAINNLLPSQGSNSGKILQTDGTNVSWVNAPATGITSINGATGSSQTFQTAQSNTAPTFTRTGDVHTLNIPQASTNGVTAGTISYTDYQAFSGKQNALGFTPLNPANNLSELTATAATARTNLGLGTAATKAYGTAVGNLVEVGAGGKIPASLLPDQSGPYFTQGGNAFGAPAVLGTTEAQPLHLQTGGTNKLTILDNGNVGIGTTPSKKLDVLGLVQSHGYYASSPSQPETSSILTFDGGLKLYRSPSVAAVPSNSGYIDFRDNELDDSDARLYWDNSLNTSGALAFATSTDGGATQDVRMVINNSNGHVGIGSTDPGVFKLKVVGDNNAFVENAGTYGLTFRSNESGMSQIYADYFTGSTAQPLALGAFPSTNAIVIKTDGRVGIGTTTPSEKLEVNGNIKATQLCIGADCRSAWPGSGGGGTVTSVGAGTGLTGGPITGSGTLSVDVGTTANKIVQLDSSAKLPGVDASALTNLNASQLSSGTLPSGRMPALSGDVTTTAGTTTTTLAQIRGKALTVTAPTAGDYLKYNGTGWLNDPLSSADLSDASSLIKASQMPANCSTGETLTFSSPTGAWICSTIANLDAGTITTGTIADARLPASAKYWQTATGGINYAGGNVGIGTTNPQGKLEVSGSGGTYIRAVNSSTSSSDMGFLAMNYRNGFATSPTFWAINYGGAMPSPTPIQSGDSLLTVGASGGSDTSWNTNNAGYISFYATENFSPTAGGGAISFNTSANGTTIPQRRMTINHNGNVSIGAGVPISQLDLNGNIDTAATTSAQKLRVASYTFNDTSTAASGTTNDFVSSSFAQPTITASNTAVTTTTASTLNVSSAPIGGARQTLTKSIGLHIRTATALGNVTNGYGLYVEAPTGAVSNYAATFMGGNVGIGAANPGAPLHIASLGTASLLVENKSSTQAYIRLFGTSGTSSWFGTSTNGGLATGINDGDTVMRAEGGGRAHIVTDYGPIISATAGGRVGIGTINPTTQLTVSSPGSYSGYTVISNINTNPGGAEWRWYSSQTGSSLGANAMCFGQSNCLLSLFGTGNASLYGTLSQSSDLRLKREISSIPHALDSITQIKGVTYFWKDPSREQDRQIGLIAQEVEKVFPEAVKTDAQGFKSVAYQNLVAPIINAIHEIRTWMLQFDDRVRSLEIENKELKAKNSAMEAYLCEKDSTASFCQH